MTSSRVLLGGEYGISAPSSSWLLSGTLLLLDLLASRAVPGPATVIVHEEGAKFGDNRGVFPYGLAFLQRGVM